VAGCRIPLSYPAGEQSIHEHEFWKILIDDCYGLHRIRRPVRTILDVGANIGLFSLMARHCFPRASIHCYEPNARIISHLRDNTRSLKIQAWHEAIGAEPGRVALSAGPSSLHTRAVADPVGEVPVTPLRLALERLGGSVDVLKLDCEGAEWQLFEDREVWKMIRYLTMEYHLWALPGTEVGKLFDLLETRDLRIQHHLPSPCGSFGLIHAESGLC
jgi:FkbM family methyltransferase